MYAFEAARQGRTALVTVVSDQTDYRIRQASSTSHTRQSRHLPFVRVYSHLLGQDSTACQLARRRAAGCSCLRSLISRRFPCRVRALDAQLLNLNCNGSRIGSALCGGRGLRVGSMNGRSMCDSLSPCSVAAHNHSLPQLNTDSAPLAITVRFRTCEFGTVSVSLGVK